jgi:endonuclease/exonuclease/phosphatase family metal-dependent hydrolase
LRSVDGLRDAFAPELYRDDESAYFTFPAHEPNRKLDHLLVSEHFEVADARVLREAGDVSDHLPLLVRLKPRPPRE